MEVDTHLSSQKGYRLSLQFIHIPGLSGRRKISNTQANPRSVWYFIHSLNHICNCCSQSWDNNTRSWFAAAFATSADNQEKYKMGALGVTINGQQLCLVSYGQDWKLCLAASITTFPSKWDENSRLLPYTKAGHNHLKSNILLETIGKLFCCRVLSYSFLETAL